MIWIYNSYARGSNYVRTSLGTGRNRNAGPAPKNVPQNKGKSSILDGLMKLPGELDLSDLMLGAVLLLLYLESKDEDFLIILGVIALSILKPGEDK